MKNIRLIKKAAPVNYALESTRTLDNGVVLRLTHTGETLAVTAAYEQQLECYATFCEDVLAMPVVRGKKTDKEKFSGAESTYTIECMMHDHKALQGGTSHYFGDGFARAFGISFADKNNQQTTPFETSWACPPESSAA